LIDKGLHPLKISDGYDRACDIATAYLDEISDRIDIKHNLHEALIHAAMTALGSKVLY
jgi:T-complex protein 1 subunit epsilon